MLGQIKKPAVKADRLFRQVHPAGLMLKIILELASECKYFLGKVIFGSLTPERKGGLA